MSARPKADENVSFAGVGVFTFERGDDDPDPGGSEVADAPSEVVVAGLPLDGKSSRSIFIFDLLMIAQFIRGPLEGAAQPR
jgi:hypothetical protein